MRVECNYIDIGFSGDERAELLIFETSRAFYAKVFVRFGLSLPAAVWPRNAVVSKKAVSKKAGTNSRTNSGLFS
jgi:hypothetical protein